ncbi:MAG: hypothetical protein HN368_09105 [Spirochaetales bacterium]|nr:hypothetical protein [Spirochaetales bacterium]
METSFNADGSGRMTMVFRISQALLQMGEEESGVDIPLSRDDLLAEFEDVDGVTVVDVTEEDTGEDRIITAVLDFDSFNDLAGGDGFPGEEAMLEEKNGKSHFSIMVGQPQGPADDGADSAEAAQFEMDDAAKAMVQSFMEGYDLEYRIVAPRKISSYSHGELSPDGRTLVFSLPMGDFFVIEEPYYLEVIW